VKHHGVVALAAALVALAGAVGVFYVWRSGAPSVPRRVALVPLPILPKANGRIAFASDREGSADVYLMNADGSGVEQLAGGIGAQTYPAWSPDGTRIVYNSELFDRTNIYVMNADGSSVKRLTRGKVLDGYPTWSPDGKKIAFMSDRDGDFAIYVMYPDGSGIARVTDDEDTHDYPAWSPDGTKLLYNVFYPSGSQVHVKDNGSGEETALTGTRSNSCCASWQPLPLEA